MKLKRWTAVVCLLLCVVTGASASFGTLDSALSPMLAGQGAVNMSVQLAVKTLMPFDETRLDLINRVLKHLRLDALIDTDAGDTDTGFQLTLGKDMLFEMTEQCRGGAYLLQTSLLPNRVLFSTQGSPMDALLLASNGEEPAIVEESADANTSDVEEAFDMLAAADELEACYRDLTDKTVLLTDKNSVSYTIEKIGKGRTSYVAKLTTDQITELLPQLRAVISCGMDAEYREELSQVTFARGFTVALYKDADGEDICVYIRGTILYPDGDRRALKWQWAFTPDRETQTFKHDVARESGRRDSRIINAVLTRVQNKNDYSFAVETKANLRRGGKNETSTLTIDITGEVSPLTCKGSVTRETGGTENGKDLDTAITEIDVDLALLASDTAAEVTGSAAYRIFKNKTVVTELELTFLTIDITSGTADAPLSVVISVTSADVDTAGQAAVVPTITAEENQPENTAYLVGAPPLGLYDYEIPPETITVNMDSAEPKIHQSLISEAVQRMAGNMVAAMLNLPPEDRELLSNGMTETDYAIFLAMLD